MDTFVRNLQIFMLMFCICYVLKETFRFIVAVSRSSKMETDMAGKVFLGLSISYILTCIFGGFIKF